MCVSQRTLGVAFTHLVGRQWPARADKLLCPVIGLKIWLAVDACVFLRGCDDLDTQAILLLVWHRTHMHVWCRKL